jgi:glycosyltransferase involved in cell wall biosynthesis
MAHVIRDVPEARLTAVAKAGFRGTDEWGKFQGLASDLGVAGSCEFHESVPQETLLGLYADCDVVALPSMTEGWGLSLMEGMVCGKAVVASRVGGIPELVRDSIDGILVEAGDVQGLREAIVSLLSDEGMRERMGRAGRQRVKDFSWDDTAKVVLEAYKDALQSP